MKRTLSALLTAAVLVSSMRCATVTDGSYERVSVTSQPPGATVAVDCGRAERRPKGKTPTVVTLQRAADPCRIVATMDGYEHAAISLRRQFSRRALSNYNAALAGLEELDAICCDYDWMALVGVYTLGSAVFGTLGLAVDRSTGAMYQHSPSIVHLRLVPLDEEEVAEEVEEQ